MSEQLFAQRRRAESMQRLRRKLKVLAMVMGIGLLIWLVWFSQVLSVRGVDVSGATSLKPDRIRDVAQVDMGQPLARVDTEAIAQRVETIPRVESADIGRGWPHTVDISVVERVAVGWIKSGGEIKVLDRHGVLFRSFEKPPKGLVDVHVDTDDAGDRKRTLKAVGKVLGDIKNGSPTLFDMLKKVEADSMDSVTFDLSKGRTVVWGSATDAAEKLRVLSPLLKLKASRYDVSAPEYPTTRK